MNAPIEPPGLTSDTTHKSTEPIEHITWNGQFIATILRRDFRPGKTTFITPDAYYQQTGLVVYPAGGVIKRLVSTDCPMDRSFLVARLGLGI